MISLRIIYIFFAIGWLTTLSATFGDESRPYSFPLQFSSNVAVLLKSVPETNIRLTVGGSRKIKADFDVGGVHTVFVVRRDLGVVYLMTPSQRTMQSIPDFRFNITGLTTAAAGPNGTFIDLGIEALNGVSCKKYKVTNSEGKASDWWISSTNACPIKMAMEDGSLTLKWSDFKAGDQDPGLFEVPVDYHEIIPGNAKPKNIR